MFADGILSKSLILSFFISLFLATILSYMAPLTFTFSYLKATLCTGETGKKTKVAMFSPTSMRMTSGRGLGTSFITFLLQRELK